MKLLSNDKPDSKDAELVEDIFAANPFATLLLGNPKDALPQVCHLPVLHVKDKACFHCHISAGNPISAMLKEGLSEAMLLFQGEHGYVSPTWHKDIRVPTWDYCVVHVKGKLGIVDDDTAAKVSMEKQIAAFEREWSMSDVDKKPLSQMLKAINVLKFEISETHYKFKMSQNKSDGAKSAIQANFATQGRDDMVTKYQSTR